LAWACGGDPSSGSIGPSTDAGPADVVAADDATDSPAPPSDVADAACVLCDGHFVGLDTLLFSADQVSAAVGSEVRFVAMDNPGMALIARIVATGESIIVLDYLPMPIAHPFTYYRLPDTGWRFVASYDGRYFLACNATECALFERSSPVTDTLVPIAGGTVPGGATGTWLTLFGYLLCVMNDGPTAWCFDRQNWTAEDAATVASQSPTGYRASETDPARCAAPSQTDDSLVRWQVVESRATLAGATQAGVIVTGAWQGSAACCCVRTAALGIPIGFGLFPCGLSLNPRLLTETALYGTADCPID
jgi:hypothetical protein